MGTLCLLVVGLGLWACWLNVGFYRRHAPFWDSVSYTLKLAQVMTVARERGIDASVSPRGVTVWLQWAEGAVAGAAGVRPSRLVGVWIQAVWLVPMVVSLYLMLRRVKGCGRGVAAAATLPFLAVAGMWRVNGGLSDFRFDLLLYVFYAMVGAWYLMARPAERWRDWVVLGACLGLGCLARATGPVYFAFALGPLVMWDLVTAGSRARRVRLAGGISLALAIAAAVAGWFFIVNRTMLLSYYYFAPQHANWDWPLRESIRHLGWAAEHVGWAAGLGAAVIGLIVCRRWRASPDAGPWWRALDLRAAYLGVAPALLMMLKGAGPNSLVTMPAAFGFVLVLMFPLRGRVGAHLARPEAKLVSGVAVASLAAALAIAAVDHLARTRNLATMTGHRQVVEAILSDSDRPVVASVWGLSQISNEGLLNVLLFEYGFEPVTMRSVRDGRRGFRTAHLVQAALEDQWRKLPGTDDAAKMRHAIDAANASVNYVLLPDEATMRYLTARLPNPLHRNLPALSNGLLERGQWEPVGGPLEISRRETYVLYRNGAIKPPA